MFRVVLAGIVTTEQAAAAASRAGASLPPDLAMVQELPCAAPVRAIARLRRTGAKRDNIMSVRIEESLKWFSRLYMVFLAKNSRRRSGHCRRGHFSTLVAVSDLVILGRLCI